MSNLLKEIARREAEGIETYKPPGVLRVTARRVSESKAAIDAVYWLRIFEPQLLNPAIFFETVDGVTTIWERQR